MVSGMRTTSFPLGNLTPAGKRREFLLALDSYRLWDWAMMSCTC